MTIEDENEIIGFWKDNASRCVDYWGFKHNYEPDIYYVPADYSGFKGTVEYKVIDMINYLKRKPHKKMQLRTEECGIRFNSYTYLMYLQSYWCKLSATMIAAEIPKYIKR